MEQNDLELERVGLHMLWICDSNWVRWKWEQIHGITWQDYTNGKAIKKMLFFPITISSFSMVRVFVTHVSCHEWIMVFPRIC